MPSALIYGTQTGLFERLPGGATSEITTGTGEHLINASQFESFDSTIFFNAQTDETGPIGHWQLKADGSVTQLIFAGTPLYRDPFAPPELTFAAYGGGVIFCAQVGEGGPFNLFKATADGTITEVAAPVGDFTEVHAVTPFGDSALFWDASGGLWRIAADGTVNEITVGPDHMMSVFHTTLYDGAVYYKGAIDPGISDFHIWRVEVDGTATDITSEDLGQVLMNDGPGIEFNGSLFLITGNRIQLMAPDGTIEDVLTDDDQTLHVPNDYFVKPELYAGGIAFYAAVGSGNGEHSLWILKANGDVDQVLYDGAPMMGFGGFNTSPTAATVYEGDLAFYSRDLVNGGSDLFLLQPGGSVIKILDRDDNDNSEMNFGVLALANEAPQSVSLDNAVASTPENGGAVKIADITVGDDGLGSNTLSLAGADASAFSIQTNGLGGKELWFTGGANFESKSTYQVTVVAEDTSVVGSTPVSNDLTLAISNVNEAPAGSDKTVSTTEDRARAFSAADFGFSDPGDVPANGFLSVTIASLPTAGTLTYLSNPVTVGAEIPVSALGDLVFTPAHDAFGTGYATFSFRVKDDGGTANGGINTDPTPKTITIDVTPADETGPTGWKFVLANNPIFDGDSQFALPLGTELGRIVATGDPNSTSFKYYFATNAAGSNPSQIYDTLSIDQTTGVISTAAYHPGPVVFPYLFVEDEDGTTFAGLLRIDIGFSQDDGYNFQSSTYGGARLGRGGKDFFITGNDVHAVHGGQGDDTIRIRPQAFADMIIDGGSGLDTIEMSVVSSPFLDSATDDQIRNFEVVMTPFGPSFSQALSIDLHRQSEGFRIIGGPMKDVITGSSGADDIRTDVRDDFIDGGPGADRMEGGYANDTYVVDNPGDVVIELPGVGNGADTVRSSVSDVLPANVEFMIFTGTANVNATGNTSDNTLTGNTGNNRLLGLGGNDTLQGGVGNDTLIGGAGADSQFGGAGNDTFQIAGSEGIGDTWSGGPGTDSLKVTGAASAKLASFNARASSIEKWVGNEKGLLGTSAANKLDFSALTSKKGLPFIDGKAGNDTLVGTKFSDDLRGGDGNDIIDGRAGGDEITGGRGRDTMSGGKGADDFNFKAVNEMGKTSVTRDRITDFEHKVDDIDLSAIDANGSAPGNAFKFLAAKGAAFTGVKGQLHWSQQNGKTIVEGDVNGDKHADFQIELTGLKTLTAGDFAL